MWIIHKAKKVTLWNKRHFEEKNGECAACLKYSVIIVVEKIYIKCNIWRVAVRPSYIWDAGFLKVNRTVHSHRKTEKVFLTNRDIWCVHHGWHGTHRWYSYSWNTPVNMDASTFFTAAIISDFKSAKSRRRVLRVLCTKCTLHSNHRFNCVIFQLTKRLLPRSRHFLTTYTCIA